MTSSSTDFPAQLQEHVPLKAFSTLKIGGPARYFLAATDIDTIAQAVQWAKKNQLPLFILGGGSNLLISDQGFPGLVLYIDLRGISSININGTKVDDAILVTAAAGEDWDNFVGYIVAQNWQGLECLSGIPGKVGATPIQNVGAYGQEVKDTIVSLTAYHREEDRIVTFTNADCHFGYRNSIFKQAAQDRYIVLDVTYRLIPNGKTQLRYAELLDHLKDHYGDQEDYALSVVREAVINVRRKKSMVLDAQDQNSVSAGSFFMNPIITIDQFNELENYLHTNKLLSNEERIPQFAAGANAGTNQLKLSAAWLIERAGFCKGYRSGNVGISAKHALALINHGDGTANEILALAHEIEKSVQTKFNIKLHHEPIYVGF